jgi:hypothetical protein
MTTLAEAREWLRVRVDDGETCPCCEQFAKVYRRKLTAPVARVLIAMYRHNRDGWVYLPALGLSRGDEAKARYWDLIEGLDGERDDGSKRVGTWRLTGKGIAFVRNQIRVPKYARIYDGRCLNMDPAETVCITDVLGTRFNYADLMAGV